MFFRRKKALKVTEPSIGEDGTLYVPEGEAYDESQYETDSESESGSDYSDESGVDEEEEEEEDDGVTTGEEMSDSDGDLKGENNAKAEGSQLELEVEPEPKSEHVQIAQDQRTDVATTIVVNNEEEKADGNENDEKEDKVVEEQTEVDIDPPSEPRDHALSEEVNDDGTQSIVKEEEPKQEESTNDQVQVDQQNKDYTTTLAEKRSLLSLAAEHDRVDIIQAVLQSSTTTPGNVDAGNTIIEIENEALIQLLLNNRLIPQTDTDDNVPSSRFFKEENLEPVFVPPLHLAIASSSTNVTTCLLRMGADPSIRPSIPKNWTGPDWWNTLKPDEPGRSSGDRLGMEEKWPLMDGVSAWELAFGQREGEKRKMHSSSTESNDDNKDQPDSKGKGGWFFRNNNDESGTSQKLNISPSKLEGILHAFTAEALRAIGSDEVRRLSELLDSGLGHQQVTGGTDEKTGDDAVSSSIECLEIGGKNLLGWCVEMGALQCSNMLKTKYNITASAVNDVEEKNAESEMKENPEADVVTIDETEIPSALEEENKTNGKEAETKIRELQIKLEESESLSTALSSMLDNLAEEVALLQALLFQNDQSSNAALLSQIRSLKESRSQKEQELSFWQAELNDRETELKMVMMWWERQGGTEDDLPKLNINTLGPAGKTPYISTSQSEKDKNRKVSEMTGQLALSENKVQKLRESIAKLAEESTVSMEKVEDLGLDGAVNLSRTLKEEVRERDFALQNAKSLEAEYRARIGIVRGRLENKISAQNSASTSSSSPVAKEIERVDLTEEEEPDDGSNMNDVETEEESSPEPASVVDQEVEDDEDIGNPNTNSILEAILRPDEEEEPVRVETSNNTLEMLDSTGTDINENCGGDDDDVNDVIPSQAIATGKSTAIVERVEGGYQKYLSFNLWDLIMRIVGLGGESMRKAVRASVGEGAQQSHVMIV